jgi:hypothetical protein
MDAAAWTARSFGSSASAELREERNLSCWGQFGGHPKKSNSIFALGGMQASTESQNAPLPYNVNATAWLQIYVRTLVGKVQHAHAHTHHALAHARLHAWCEGFHHRDRPNQHRSRA